MGCVASRLFIEPLLPTIETFILKSSTSRNKMIIKNCPRLLLQTIWLQPDHQSLPKIHSLTVIHPKKAQNTLKAMKEESHHGYVMWHPLIKVNHRDRSNIEIDEVNKNIPWLSRSNLNLHLKRKSLPDTLNHSYRNQEYQCLWKPLRN